jgi:hypothetical protein
MRRPLPKTAPGRVLVKAVSQVPVAHTCNPSYSGDQDQEDHGSKLPWENCFQDPILKIPNAKQG